MILDTTLITLKAVLAGSVTTSQPEVTVDYRVWDVTGQPTKPATFRAALNGTTDVIILPAPLVQGQVFEPLLVSIFNKDTASIVVTVKTDNGTQRGIISKTVATLETLHWAPNAGWYVTSH